MNQDKFERLLSSTFENINQSMYDDWVEENTRFRAQAGLKAFIIRREVYRCCDWCRSLSGIFEYGTEPKDIYKRHDNCKCLVTFKSERGTYQDVWSKKEFNTQREARIQRQLELLETDALRKESVTMEYFANAKPGVGKLTIENRKEVKPSELEYAQMLIDRFGGDITILETASSKGIHGVDTPDYLWRGKLWDLKETISLNGVDKRLQSGIHQIETNPGGVIIVFTDKPGVITTDKQIADTIKARARRRSYPQKIDVMVIRNGDIVFTLRV